jgi:hypothetical protein
MSNTFDRVALATRALAALQTRFSAVHQRVKGLRPAASKVDEAGDLRELSAMELALVFLVWLTTFAAFTSFLLVMSYFV